MLVYGDKFSRLKDRAINRLGAKDLQYSLRMNKKYVVTLKNGKKVHFGDNRYEDFLTHGDLTRRARYRKRASRIRDENGGLTYLNMNSPNHWSYHLLW